METAQVGVTSVQVIYEMFRVLLKASKQNNEEAGLLFQVGGHPTLNVAPAGREGSQLLV